MGPTKPPPPSHEEALAALYDRSPAPDPLPSHFDPVLVDLRKAHRARVRQLVGGLPHDRYLALAGEARGLELAITAITNTFGNGHAPPGATDAGRDF